MAAPVLRPAGLRERGTRVLRQLLAAAEGQGFVQAVSHWAPSSGNPSAACIHPPAPKGNNIHTTNPEPFGKNRVDVVFQY